MTDFLHLDLISQSLHSLPNSTTIRGPSVGHRRQGWTFHAKTGKINGYRAAGQVGRKLLRVLRSKHQGALSSSCPEGGLRVMCRPSFCRVGEKTPVHLIFPLTSFQDRTQPQGSPPWSSRCSVGEGSSMASVLPNFQLRVSRFTLLPGFPDLMCMGSPLPISLSLPPHFVSRAPVGC